MTGHVTVQVLEWVVDAFGFASNWLLTGRRRAGWVLSLAGQVVWLGVAVPTGQWAFVLASLVYGAVAVRGWVAWRRPVEAVSAP